MNLYRYVRNGPVNGVDPWGMQQCQPDPLKDILKGPAFGFMAVGIVTWEVTKIVVYDVTQILVIAMIPTTEAGAFAIDRSVALINITHGVAGDYKEIAVRIDNRIKRMKDWWYPEGYPECKKKCNNNG